MAIIAPYPKFQVFDSNGNPLSGGRLYTYAAGTTTPLATYTTPAGNVANANPVVLDSRGEANVWLPQNVLYKFVLKTSADVTIWTVDNVTSLNIPLVSDTTNFNLAVGYAALDSVVPASPNGVKNVAVGQNALTANTDGNGNTAVGHEAIKTNTTGAGHTAVGANSLALNTTGDSNTAYGYDSMYKNTTGSSNVALGKGALYSNDTGTGNVAVGLDAIGTGLYPAAGKAGDYNVGIGYNALTVMQNSDYNVGIGFEVGANCATLTQCVAVGSGALRGAAGGTSSATTTTAVGFNACYSVTINANNNTALGAYALYLLTTGDENTAIGVNALRSGVVANNNTAVGMSAMNDATSAADNVAVGHSALYTVGNGTQHVAVGKQALETTGNNANYNTAVGYRAGRLNQSGQLNTFAGWQAGYTQTAGDSNVGVGQSALYTNTASSNTAVGAGALKFATNGGTNTALGAKAGDTLTTGSNITCIGYDAQPSGVGATNEVTVGNTSIGSARVQVAWTVLSDARDKVIRGDLPVGLAFVGMLKPRYGELKPRGADWSKPMPFFIAQEVLEAENAAGVRDITQLINDTNPDRLEMTSERLLPILTKAIQDLHGIVRAQGDEITILKGLLNA